jgi:hypothetical protein
MPHPLAGHPPWRQLVIVSIVLPAMIVLAILAFAWPSARMAPRHLPVGIVGSGSASHSTAAALASAEPGAFEVHAYPDRTAAETAIRHRDIYGAFVVGPTGFTVLTASAASPTVAQLLTATGQQLSAHASGHPSDSAAAPLPVTSIDVVASSPADPRGLVLSSAVLPLSICSLLVAAGVALLVGFRPAWRQLVALTVVSSVAGLGGYLVTQSFLGALPGRHLATWAALSLTILAISATTAGLIAILGPIGLGLSAVLMVFIGNPFGGVGSAPQLLPAGVDHLGQWLPPGAGANLLRSTAYFDGHGAAGHLLVLIGWIAFGFGAVVVGHHTSPRFAAHPARRRDDDAARPVGARTEVDQRLVPAAS